MELDKIRVHSIMSTKKYRKGRPDKSCVLISIERHICLQSIVCAIRQGETERVSRLLKDLVKIETHDFITGFAEV